MSELSFTAVTAVLELTASEHAQLFDFQLEVILGSPVRLAVYQLAEAFGVPHDEVGEAVYQACVDLNRLEKLEGARRDLAKTLESTSLVTLRAVCQARLRRVSSLVRRRRLVIILKSIERAYELALSRAWIEDFLGHPLPRKPQEAEIENR